METLDLGYRWMSGEMDEWEVLAELWGCSVPLAKARTNEGLEDMSESYLAWKRAGDTFEWLLGESPPNGPTCMELLREKIDPATV